MIRNKITDISTFFIAGINYKKTDASVRGQFAISPEQYENILSIAPSYGLNELFILSTCNRTEIYGFAEDASQLIELLCTQTAGKKEAFTERCYIKKGTGAISHLFQVAAGLDSQILGDYEIIGQIKQAVKFSRERLFVLSFLDRLVNCVLQASKLIKNETTLSGGTVSVSYAAVQYIKQHISLVADKKILVVGVGKIGRNTCKNLVDYLCTKNITLINRSEEKAAALAHELGLQHASISSLASAIDLSDIILVSTNAEQPVILQSQLANSGEKLIIDLSIPYNVEYGVKTLNNIKLVNVDELSKMKDVTLQKREAEIPKAQEIIDTHIAAFMQWLDMRRHVPVLKAVKTKLAEIHTLSFFSAGNKQRGHTAGCADEKIQRVVNLMATKMRSHPKKGCHYIEAINEFIGVVAN